MIKRRVKKGFFIAAAVCGVSVSYPIWKEYVHQKAVARQARVEMKHELGTLGALKAEKARYKDPASVEEMLRERGYWEKDAKQWVPVVPKPTEDFGDTTL